MKTFIILLTLNISATISSYLNPCYNRQWKIKLIESKHEDHRELNKRFIDDLDYFSSVILIRVEDDDTFRTIVDTKHFHPYYYDEFFPKLPYSFRDRDDDYILINLNATDFSRYSEFDNDRFIYIGKGIKTIKKDSEICIKKERCYNKTQEELKSDTKMQKECEEDHKKMRDENCETSEVKYDLKVVSNNILEFPALYNYTENFNTLDTNIYKKELCRSLISIVVCGDYDERLIEELIPPWKYQFELRYELNCNEIKVDPTTIAIFAPRPFNSPEPVFTTTIFYEDDYAAPEVADMFINPVLGTPQTKVKYALHKFMKMNNLKRVAIISDDSVTSQEFQRELTAMFDEEKKHFNILYVSKSCDVQNCDFGEILKPLIAAKTKLIIANIGEEYAEVLTEQFNKMVHPNLAWIFTSWSKNIAEKASKKGIGKVLSINLHLNKAQTLIEGYLHYSKEWLYDETKNNEKYIYEKLHDPLNKIRKLHGELATEIKYFIYEKASIKAFVHEYGNSGTKEIASMAISPENQITDYKQDIININTEIRDCMFKSSVYMKPCHDLEFMFFVLVASMFILMAVGIVYFFNSAEISYSRMSP